MPRSAAEPSRPSLVGRLLALAAASTLGLGLAAPAQAAPAQAARLVLHDGAGDVYRHHIADPWVPAPQVHNGDVLRTRVTHRGKQVVVRTRYVALRRKGRYAAFDLFVRNGQGKTLEFLLDSSPHHWHGRMRAFHQDGSPARCQAGWTIDYRHNAVTMRVPRGCLDNPAGVRIRTLSWWADGDATFFTDNPHNHSAEVSGWSDFVRHC